MQCSVSGNFLICSESDIVDLMLFSLSNEENLKKIGV